MEFYEYVTYFSCLKKIDPSVTIDDVLSTELEVSMHLDSGCKSQISTEIRWMQNNRPYFNLYPSMAEVLSKINYDFDCERIKWPQELKEQPLTIRFAKNHKPICVNENGRGLQSIMAIRSDNISVSKSQNLETGMVIFANFGLIPKTELLSTDFNIPDTYWISFPLRANVSLEKVIHTYIANSDKASPYYSFLDVIIRIVVGLLLVAEDQDYCIPDVLTKHKAKFAEEKDIKYVEKAKRNGKFGWTIGEQLETIPHFRRPHFGFRYTGTGRTIKKLVPIKGAIVNRNKINLPQGYQDEL